MNPTTPQLASITFDCRDALTLGRFWSAVLDRTLADGATSDYAQLRGEPAWSFMSVPEPKKSKNRVHVDLDVPDLAAAVDRLLAAGASRVGDFNEHGFAWTTLADPEGNEFDVVAAA